VCVCVCVCVCSLLTAPNVHYLDGTNSVYELKYMAFTSLHSLNIVVYSILLFTCQTLIISASPYRKLNSKYTIFVWILSCHVSLHYVHSAQLKACKKCFVHKHD